VIRADLLTENALGFVSFAVHVPWNPNEVVPPGAIVPL
jgi:hypothetical protein